MGVALVKKYTDCLFFNRNGLLSMNLRSNQVSAPLMILLLIAAAGLSGGCGNATTSVSPTSTPIPVYTPWSLSTDVRTPASAATPATAPTAATTPTVEATATSAPTATPEPMREATATTSPTETLAPTVEPTASPAPTDTPAPTPEATATTAPTATPASAPEVGGDDALDPEVAALLATANPANGEQLTVANGCIACHSLQEGVVMVGPSWHNVGAAAPTRVTGQSAAAYLYQSIVSPNAHVVDGFQPNLMPPTYRDALTAPQLADIIAYLLSLGAE